MYIVGPLRGLPKAALGERRDHGGVVEIALRDERQRPSQFRGERCRLLTQLGKEMSGGVVAKGVHGVKPQHVDVEVAEPAQRVVGEKATHLRGPGLVKVDCFAPRRCDERREVRPELRHR